MLSKLFKILGLVSILLLFLSNTAFAATNPQEVCDGAKAIGLSCKICDPDCAITFLGAVKVCTICNEDNCAEDDCNKCSDQDCVNGD